MYERRIEDFHGEPFDVSICTEVLEHVSTEDAGPLLAALARNMKPGGLCIFTTPCQFQTQRTNNPHHVQEYSFLDFMSLLGGSFSCRCAWWYHWPTALLTPRPTSQNVAGMQSEVVQIVIAQPKG